MTRKKKMLKKDLGNDPDFQDAFIRAIEKTGLISEIMEEQRKKIAQEYSSGEMTELRILKEKILCHQYWPQETSPSGRMSFPEKTEQGFLLRDLLEHYDPDQKILMTMDHINDFVKEQLDFLEKTGQRLSKYVQANELGINDVCDLGQRHPRL